MPSHYSLALHFLPARSPPFLTSAIPPTCLFPCIPLPSAWHFQHALCFLCTHLSPCLPSLCRAAAAFLPVLPCHCLHTHCTLSLEHFALATPHTLFPCLAPLWHWTFWGFSVSQFWHFWQACMRVPGSSGGSLDTTLSAFLSCLTCSLSLQSFSSHGTSLPSFYFFFFINILLLGWDLRRKEKQNRQDDMA